ncbi:membrane-bound PQQ-dependent dehydrogenase, glucose/quinate/shikimate family, partial [Klebsiella pneumoniae]|nr:membrane-bound PQQ-dependent dehydrogenase, glucose/quinate/shikimate family [Klebsiella pneumoniae]
MNQSASKSGLRTLTVMILALIALFLLIGGVWLAAIGGSFYYVIAGVLLLIVAVQLYKRASGPLWVYAALMLGSVIWGVWEVGTDFWALAPRLDVLGVLGLWLLVPAVTRGIDK